MKAKSNAMQWNNSNVVDFYMNLLLWAWVKHDKFILIEDRADEEILILSSDAKVSLSQLKLRKCSSENVFDCFHPKGVIFRTGMKWGGLYSELGSYYER